MNTRFIRAGVISLGILGTSLLTGLTFNTASVKAQLNTQLNTIVADGRLTSTEYSPVTTAPVLVRGVVSSSVRDVQTFLRRRGFFNGEIDGIYGPNTYSAVVTFQRSRNLTADGKIGSQTWEALLDAYNRTARVAYPDFSEYSPSTAPVLRIGSRSQAVIDLQAFLRQQGLYTGAVDGIYGRATAAAVESYQQRYAQLRNDGIVGRSTWNVILDNTVS
ncbi:MAG: peptidoglycan-binding protein [Hapalosiphonaceae cyanobacterium JJU2]|nr:MAG: peptidoglycan-binding protein [Hapalosiphonaceae cyanobacterium JJU2]